MENTTQAQIEFLQVLKQVIEVKIYALTIPQNAGSLAQLWQGNQPVLTQFLTPTNAPTLHFGSTTFLNQVQSKLIGEQATFKLDPSIQIDGHYTTYREVEGLFNHLIKYFEEHPKAASRNIVVYCNDIKQYIPAIHYFFQHEKYKIPYRIFGDFTYEQNTTVHAVEALINYDKEALAPEEILSLIQIPAIAKKFGFNTFEAIRNWISSANIRQGYEGDSTIELDLISWKKGLNRLMLGSLTGCEATTEESYLLDVTEGSDLNELIALTHFIHLLNEFQIQTKTNRPLVDWVSLTTDFIENCIDTTYDPHFSLFNQYIHQFDLTAKESIPYSTWQLMTKAYFTEIPSIKKPGTNGVIFTELKQTQIIPADVSAVLGLNYNTFPRQHQVLGFDLLQNNKEMHYHLAKELDKFNLLQVLLQTTNQLYLSYQSHDPKSNKELPPSLVIEQIIDFSDDLLNITHHPLHGFSTSYNRDNSNLYSYTQEATNIESILDQLSVLPAVEEEQTNEVIVNLNEFIRYFQDSFKHFYNKKLGIYLDQEVNALPHHETLETNSLTDWKIKNYFIDNDINYLELSEEEKKEHIFQFKLSGDLPLQNLGNYYVDKALNKYEDVFINYFKFISDKTKTQKKIEYIIEINGTKYIIKGSINLFNGQLIFPVFSSNTNKYKFEWILKSLILDLDESNSNILYLNSKKAFTIEQFKSNQIKSLITIENLVTKFISKNFNPFYLTFSSKEVTEFDSLKNNIMTDLFGNEYVVQLITKRVFQTDEALIQQFIENQNLTHQLLTA